MATLIAAVNWPETRLRLASRSTRWGIGSDWDEICWTTSASSAAACRRVYPATDAALALFEQQNSERRDVAVRNATLPAAPAAGVSPKKAVKVLPIIADLARACSRIVRWSFPG